VTRSGVVQVERGGLLVAPGGAKAEGRVIVDDPEARYLCIPGYTKSRRSARAGVLLLAGYQCREVVPTDRG
jgi:hypothetical protein